VLGYWGAELVSTPTSRTVALTSCPVVFTPGVVSTTNVATFLVMGSNTNVDVTVNINVDINLTIIVICCRGTCGVDIGVCVAGNCKTVETSTTSEIGVGGSGDRHENGSWSGHGDSGSGSWSGGNSAHGDSLSNSGSGSGSVAGGTGSVGSSTYKGPWSNSASAITKKGSFISLMVFSTLALLL
jgi:hypothetical protein